jgi:hypothetical protein
MNLLNHAIFQLRPTSFVLEVQYCTQFSDGLQMYVLLICEQLLQISVNEHIAVQKFF